MNKHGGKRPRKDKDKTMVNCLRFVYFSLYFK